MGIHFGLEALLNKTYFQSTRALFKLYIGGCPSFRGRSSGIPGSAVSLANTLEDVSKYGGCLPCGMRVRKI